MIQYQHQLLLQIIVGKKGQETGSKDTSSSLPPAIGTIVAVFLEKYSDEIPQIGKVLKTDDDDANIEIKWFTGCYSGQ